jgi:hypothetical protein
LLFATCEASKITTVQNTALVQSPLEAKL